MSLLGTLGGFLGINKQTVDTISKVGKGFLAGGPVGAAGAFVSDAVNKIQAGRVSTSNPSGMVGTPVLRTISGGTPGFAGMQTITNRLLGAPPPLLPKIGPGMPQLPDSTKTSGLGLPGGGFVGTQTNYFPGGGAGTAPAQGDTRGYHLNKSGYYTKGGNYVAPRSKWVKNRRRNPLNPRALSRSISRISSAKNAAKFLGRVSVRSRAECR